MYTEYYNAMPNRKPKPNVVRGQGGVVGVLEIGFAVRSTHYSIHDKVLMNSYIVMFTRCVYIKKFVLRLYYENDNIILFYKFQ